MQNLEFDDVNRLIDKKQLRTLVPYSGSQSRDLKSKASFPNEPIWALEMKKERFMSNVNSSIVSPSRERLLHSMFGSTGELSYSVSIRLEKRRHTLLFKPKYFVEAMEYAGFNCLENDPDVDEGNQSHPTFDGFDGPVTSEATGGNTYVYYQNATPIPNEKEVFGRLHSAHTMIGLFKMFPDSYRKETSARKSAFAT